MKLTKRDMILLAVLGVVAVLGGAFWFVVKPAKSELSSQRDRLAQVQEESAGLRDTIARLSDASEGEAKRTAERLRLAKALPETTETPGVVVQLQRLADRANVELTSIKTNNYTDFGTIRGTEFEIRVTGRFFDVDDFLYRLHRQVSVDERDRPVVGGRLFATTAVDLTLDQSGSSGGAPSKDDQVIGTVRVMAFSSVPGAATPAAPVPASAVSGPAPAPSPAPATGTTTNEPSTTPPAGGTSSGGTQ